MEDERLRLAGAIQRQRTAVEQKDASVAELKRNVELARSRLSDCAIERVRVEHALGVAADKGKAEAENLTRLVKLKDADVLDAHRRKHVIGTALAYCIHTHSLTDHSVGADEIDKLLPALATQLLEQQRAAASADNELARAQALKFELQKDVDVAISDVIAQEAATGHKMGDLRAAMDVNKALVCRSVPLLLSFPCVVYLPPMSPSPPLLSPL
jgi:hypothetical protein